MRRSSRLALLALMLLLSSCTPFRLQQAGEGLKATLADLPQSGFTAIATVPGEYYHKFGNSMCYYGQAIVAVGSDLPEDEALASYIRALEAKGWQAQNSLGRSRELVRGEHESLEASIGGPGWILESDPDFQRRRGDFRSLVYLGIDYYLPGRAACMGE